MDVGPSAQLLSNALLGGFLISDERHDEILRVAGELLQEGELSRSTRVRAQDLTIL